MDVNDTKAVIEALLEALTRHPENDALRLHVACVCLAKGNPEEALAQASLVLSAQPDNLEALQCAAQSAEMMGEDARSRAYFRLYEALRGEKHLPSKPAGVKNFPEVESDSIYLDDQESAAFVDREKPLSSEARDVLLDETDELREEPARRTVALWAARLWQDFHRPCDGWRTRSKISRRRTV
jgi:hypothetical protein